MRQLLFLLIGFLFYTFAFAETPPANPFTLTSNAFLDSSMLPVIYTCDGKEKSPQLDWTGAPAKIQTFTLILSDSKAPNGIFYHWVLFNIPKNTASLPEGIDKLPAGTMVGKNSFGKTQYNGPCPPKGASHPYLFTLYALDNKLTLSKDADAKAVLAAMDKHILAKAELTAIYSRWFN